MPRPHTTMRQIRDVLRLVLRDNVSRRTTALSLSVPRTSVNDLVTRALAAEITWEVANELDDTQLESRLFHPVAKETTRPQLDFDYVKRELAKKEVTLQLLWLEYLEQHPGGYGYSQFCHLYAPITSYSHAQLVALIRWIESDDVVRSKDAVLEIAIRELGYLRRGGRIVETLNATIEDARRRRPR